MILVSQGMILVLVLVLVRLEAMSQPGGQSELASTELASGQLAWQAQQLPPWQGSCCQHVAMLKLTCCCYSNMP